MALSPATGWVEAVQRADFQPVYLIELTDGVWSYKATKGSTALGYPEAVLSIDPIAAEFDPFTRKPKGSAIKIVFDDDWIRPIVSGVDIKHQKCIISIGAPEIVEGDYLGIFAGPIEEIMPEGKQHVTLEVEDVFTVLQKTKIVGYWYGHPLDIIEDILINKVGLAAAMVDTTSLDHTLYSDIGHLNVARGAGLTDFQIDTGVREPTPAFELVDSLCQLLNGQLITNESGQITFQQFDATASAVDTWDADVIKPGSFEQLTDEGRIVNRIMCSFARGVDGKHNMNYQADDTASQASKAYPTMSERILALDPPLSTDWLDYRGTLAVALGGGAGDLTAHIGGPLFAWSGARKQVGVAQSAFEVCSATRPVYLMLTGANQDPEIVKATTITFTTSGGGTGYDELYAIDPEDGQRDHLGTYHTHAQFTIVRAQLGTTRQAWGADYAGCVIYDITALVLLCDELLERFVSELHMVRLKTGWDQMAVQQGDFVKLNWDEFLAYGFDGIDDTHKWEVIGKEILEEGEPLIALTLAYAGTSAITRTGSGKGKGYQDSASLMDVSLAEQANIVGAVASGFDLTDDGGRVATISSGVAAIAGIAGSHLADTQRTYTASTTTYAYWNTRTQQLGFREESSEPTWAPHEVPLWYVTTSGVDITATGDLRVKSAMDGVRLHDDTVGIAVLNREQETGFCVNPNPSLDMYTRG